MRAFRPLKKQLGFFIGLGLAISRQRGANSYRPSLSVDFMRSPSLVPFIGANFSPIYARASVAKITDQDLIWRDVLSGEARFGGFRRVRNLVTNSESASVGFRATPGATVTQETTDFPTGTTKSIRLAITNVATLNIQKLTANAAVGEIRRQRVWLKGEGTSIGRSVVLTFMDNGGFGQTGVTVVTLTANWQIASIPLSSAYTLGTDTAITISGTGLGAATIQNGDTMLCTGFMTENVTGASNQNPGEYQSTGVLSAPFQGSNVDGVRCYATLNGNTVASNIVTEATGAAISTSILGGFLPEAGATNLCLRSENFAVTWAVTDTTITSTNNADPAGSLTGTLLTEGVAGTAVNTQAITITANATYTFDIFLKRGNHDWAEILFFETATPANAITGFFNLNTGAAGTAGNGGTATGAAIEILPMANGYYRCRVSGAVNNGATAITIQTQSATADGNAARINNGTRLQWGAQFVSAKWIGLINSYIATVGSTVTRSGDSLSYLTTGWLNALAGTLYAEWFNPNNINTAVVASINNGTTNNTVRFYVSALTTATFDVRDGAGTQANLSAAVITAGAIAKAAGVYQANDFDAWANNTRLGTGDTSGTVPSVSQIDIGHQNNTVQLGHYVRKVDYRRPRLASASAQALTV